MGDSSSPRKTLNREELADSEKIGIFPYFNTVTLSDNPDIVAQNIRTYVGISLERQYSWRSPNEAFNVWKDSIERLNVLIFHTNHQKGSAKIEDMRGFSISAEMYPVIVLNSKDTETPRIFTLFHELTHLLMNNGGVCNDFDIDSPVTQEQRIEVFSATVLQDQSLYPQMHYRIVQLC